MTSMTSTSVFDIMDRADAETLRVMARAVATARGVKVSEVQAEFLAWREARDAQQRAAAARAERAAVAAEATKLTLASGEEKLGAFLTRAAAAGMGVKLTPDGKLSVTGTGAGKGGSKGGGATGRGRGRPAADAPSPFVTSEGSRVYGSLPNFVREEVPEGSWEALGLVKGGKLKGGSALQTACLRAGLIKRG